MNFIKEFIEKYNGDYNEGLLKSAHTPGGKITFQKVHGALVFKASRITISFTDAGGAHSDSDLFRIRLLLAEPSNLNLLIFPRSFWSRIFSSLSFLQKPTFRKTTRRQYKFSGSRRLLEYISSNGDLMREIENEFVCIQLSKKEPQIITLTPSHGIKNLAHLEKLAGILKLVEHEIVSGD